MHDFEERIASWRRELHATIGDRDAVEELEGHLREILAGESIGKSADEAWRSAVERLGDRDALAREYKKVHGALWVDGAIYAATLMALGFVLLGLVMPMVAGLRNDPTRALLITHVASVTAGYTLAISGGILGLHYALRAVLAKRNNRLLGRLLPKTVALFATAAVPITLLGVLLGAAWSAEHRGVAFSWDIREVTALLVIMVQAGVVLSVCCDLAARISMGFASFGCGVALCAWFTPALLQASAYGFASLLLLIAAHVIAALFMLTGVFVAARTGRVRAA